MVAVMGTPVRSAITNCKVKSNNFAKTTIQGTLWQHCNQERATPKTIAPSQLLVTVLMTITQITISRGAITVMAGNGPVVNKSDVICHRVL